MRNCYRTSCRNLFFKQRNNTSVGAKHVAETNCYKLRLIMAVERLHDHLADSLARTHDIRRGHRLVCRNHDELFRVVLCRRHSGFPGAEYIVFDRLVGAVLHQRHMLMRCCMVHNIGMIRFKHIVDPARVAHAADQNHQIQLRILFLQFLLQVVGIVFINIKHDQLRRLVTGNLTAQLASDGTAAACNEHNLILHISQNGIDIHADRFPAQQVFDLDVPQLADVDFAVYELIQSGKAAQLAVCLFTDFQDILNLRRRRRGDRQENFINIV